MKAMTWGTLPKQEEFLVAFYDACPRGTFRITHGSESSTNLRPPAGEYTPSALWNELERLNGEGEEAESWCSDILGTLGFEWI